MPSLPPASRAAVRLRAGVVGVTLFLAAGPAPGQSADLPASRPAFGAPTSTGLPSAPSGTAGRVSDGLAKTFLALGASSGIPDGVGGWYYPAQPVRGQNTRLGISGAWAGGAVPVWDDETDGLFLTGAFRSVGVNTSAALPDDRVPLPNRLWDIQTGAVYLRRLSDDRAWGVSLTAGSASDRPFHSTREATATALAFYRTPAADDDHWLFYVLSESTGQVGRNIPIPGAAFEFSRDRLQGVVGFPFLSLTWTPIDRVEATFFYAALSDLQTRASYTVAPDTKVYTAFAWTYESWFRAGRTDRADQLFWYEKRAEGGVAWSPRKWVSVQATAGFAFDRYFTETHGLTLTGRNRIDFGAGPFATIQVLAQY